MEDVIIRKIIISLLLLLYLFSLPFVQIAYSQEQLIQEPASSPQSQDLAPELNKIKDQLQEVRRDQLNYKLEKDILKEAYSSNLKTLEIILTFVVILFSLLGFFGLKSLWAVMDKIKKEIDEINILKSNYETKFNNIMNEQEGAKQKFEEILKV